MTWKFREENRRKDNCITCNRFMPIKAKNNCQNCWHKIKRKNDPNFFLRTRYTEIVQRCSNPNNIGAGNYLGKKFCTRKEFLDKFLRNETFLELFKDWQKNDHHINFCPSVDRINNEGDYTLDNIQFMTMYSNHMKDREFTPVNCYDYKSKQYINSYESQVEAARQLNIHQANIWKVLNKLRKHTCGYYFEYK